MERKRRVKEDFWTSSSDLLNLIKQISRISPRKTKQLQPPLAHPQALQPLLRLTSSQRSPPLQRRGPKAQHLNPDPGKLKPFEVPSVSVLQHHNLFPVCSRDASSRSQPTDYSSSSDRSEELRTPDSIDEPWEGSDGRGSPQGGKRYTGVQMMGSGLLAEMKAKQERRAYKVRGGLPNQKIKKECYKNSFKKHPAAGICCLNLGLKVQILKSNESIFLFHFI